MEPIRTLLDRAGSPGSAVLPAELRRLYGGELQFPAAALPSRPYVIGNFVSTFDGIVSYRIPGKAGGGTISGNNQPDRFIMGLLRASADAVMIGAGTLHATDASHSWTADAIYPEAGKLYDVYRKAVLGKPKPPETIVVSASGVVDLERPMFHTSTIAIRIITTAKGRDRLRSIGAHKLPATELTVLDSSAQLIAPDTILEFLRAQCGVSLLLHEGGSTLFGEFVAARLVDEFFLTVAPQIAGCTPDKPRPTLVSGTEFQPETAPWLRVLSVKQSGDHLYLRYGSGYRESEASAE